MFRKVAAFVLTVLCLVGMFGCAEEGKTEQSAFDFSLGQYIGAKSYKEMLDILSLDPETVKFERLVLSLDDVDYNGTAFGKSLAFSVGESDTFILGSVSYSHIFDESADAATIKQMVEKIYTELGAKYSNEPLTDENGTRYFEDTIADMLADEGLGSGVSYWAADNAGCEVVLSCQYLDPTTQYRITISERAAHTR